jgi:outer membrane receptor protein involved in Fe transport
MSSAFGERALPVHIRPSDGWAQPFTTQETMMGNAQQSPRIARIFLACLWLVFPATVTAQSSTASINGKVRDPSGSIVPGTDVVLTSAQTNVERRTTTNEAGVYVFLNVIPGQYRLQASKMGFRTSKQPAFNLVVNQTVTFDFNLQVGEITQEVTVEAVGAEVQSSTAELGAVVGHQQVQDLPLNGRNFTQLLSLTPGASPVSVAQNAGGWGAVSAGATFSFPSINGQTNRSNFFMLDGINNQGAFLSTYAVAPIIDSIQEFKVQSHNDEAEFGGALGGIVNVVTKSGTNKLHGSVWEYLRNDAFDARNTFFQEKTPFRQNQYGAAVGGPVVLPKLYNGRNQTFFFAAWQGWRYRRPANTFFRVPTEANLRGDLSDVPQQIFNPFSTREDPDNPGTFIRDPFPNNQIPAELIHPGMVRFAQETLPPPVFTGNADRNGLDSTPYQQNQEEYTFRLDQMLGLKDSLWFRYTGITRDDLRSGGRQSISSIVQNPAKNWAISWVHSFNPSTVLQTQFGHVHSRYDEFTKFRDLPPSFALDIGFAESFARSPAGGVALVPSIEVADFFGGGESYHLHPDFTNIYQYKANASKIVGNHTFKWGGEINSNGLESLGDGPGVSFSSVQTNDPRNPGGTGSALASFLLNVPWGARDEYFHESLRWGGVLGFYFHDQWKATPRLTVNLGLRYDRTFIPPYGAEGTEGENGGIETGSLDLIMGRYILQKQSPYCSERGRAPCIPGSGLPEHVVVDPRGKIYHDTTKNFQPRLGLAYRLAPSTALRASFGVFFDNWAAVTQTAQNYAGSWPDVANQLAVNLNNPSPSSPTPTSFGTDPFPEGPFPASTPFNQVAWFMDPNFKNPYSMQWNLGVQRQLNQSTLVTANYVGSGSRRLQIGGFYNVAVTPGPGEKAPRQPFPYISPSFFDRSWGRANYHAFQFLLDKKYSNGLAYLVSYTWSKSIDIACSGWYGVEGCSVQDPYHFNNDRSVSGYDIPHLLSISWVYQLPVGTGKKYRTGSRVLNHIVGNWQVNGIATFHSGLPYDVGVAGDIANTGNVGYSGYYMRLNLVRDHKLSNPTPQNWFNRSAFAVPELYTFGNLGRNSLRGDGTQNLDLSFFRQFPLGESKSVEFRVEMFNAFNTPEYALPERNFASQNFGSVLATANQARQMQFGLKIVF